MSIGYVLNRKKIIGLLDGIIGLDYWIVFFHPNMGSVVVHSSQERVFCFCFAMLCCAAFLAGTFSFLLLFVQFLKKVILGKRI